MHLHYCERLNRDRAATRLRAQGYKVSKSSSRNTVLHRAYVTDAPGRQEAIVASRGLNAGPEWWAVLYHLEAVREPRW